jgi:hypothetical protein
MEGHRCQSKLHAQLARAFDASAGRFEHCAHRATVPGGRGGALDDFRSPIAIAADETVQGLADLPALVGQLCRIVDLDAPLFLQNDRAIAAAYQDGSIACPDALWGNPPGSG